MRASVRSLCWSSESNAAEIYNVFRYSTSACFSSAGRSMPNTWPPLPFERSLVSYSVPTRCGFVTLRDEADVHRIVEIVTAPEQLGPIRDGFEQVAQRRHRAVVQVRRAQPDAVEERRVVADRASPRPAPCARCPSRSRPCWRQSRFPCSRCRVAFAIGVDAVERHAPPGLVARVAARAVRVEHRLAARPPAPRRSETDTSAAARCVR